jgi:fatty-acyl-CoA synthase
MHTIAEKLLHLSESAPGSLAVRLLFNQGIEINITNAQLIQGSTEYSQAYENSSIQPGEVVILILQHGEELLYAFFGAILRGCIPAIMPFLTEKLSVEQYRRSLKALFEVTTPAAVVTYPEFLPEVQPTMQNNSSVRVILNSSQISSHSEISTGSFDAGLQRSPDEIALLQHSSGTTGLQKGVALSHLAVLNQLDSYSRALQLNSSDVVVSWLPLYHDMGLIAGFLLPILSGIPLVLLSPFDWVRAPHQLLHAVSQYKGTLSWLPNFAFNFCSQKIRPRDLEDIDLSSWRAVSNCSEPMYWKSHQMFLDRFRPYGLRSSALTTCYAMAENVFAVTQGGITESITVDPISQRGLLLDRVAIPAKGGEEAINMLSAGRPLDNTQVKIVDQEYHELGERRLGEIAIKSNCMLTGYYHRPDISKDAFHAGWYMTGDLGYIAKGEVYVTGRKKDLIIVGGKNIYPQDLEALAGEVGGVHPGRVCAFGVPNEVAGTEDVVIIAEVDGLHKDQKANEFEGSLEMDRIADEIRTRVTRGSDIALRLVKLVGRGWLVKTSSGKIARNANRERYLTGITSGQ